MAQSPFDQRGGPAGGEGDGGLASERIVGWAMRMNRAPVFLWAVPLLILGTQTPIFLQMTLTPDAVRYDIQTGCLM